MRDQERRLTAVPWTVFLFLAAALALQVSWALHRGAPSARAAALPEPPSLSILKVVSLGQPEVLARILMLWLQGFDYQPGISIAFRDLDYQRVEAALVAGFLLVAHPAVGPLLAEAVHKRLCVEDWDQVWHQSVR